VFDEPTIGLHPLDVEVLLGVLERLVQAGATVVVIEHDLDMIANADYVIDMGPGGGEAGGRVVCAGSPEEVAACPESITGSYLR
jgi:excinuclease ABC subunit A